jgi:tetratricopeptide (TPR) repeat protein
LHQLKKLARESLPLAIEKAEQYRALGEPEEAESICRDVLETDPDDQAALRILGLAITDTFQKNRAHDLDEAVKVFGKLTSEYERVYYTGIAWERAGKAHLGLGEHHNALACFEHALEKYEQAEKLAPPHVPDPVLRWNWCVRILREHPELVRAHASPHSKTPMLGD